MKKSSRGELAHAWFGERNVLNLYNKARTYEREIGVSYWKELRRRLAFQFGEENVEKMAGAFCALSPNNSEDSNWRDLESMWQAWRQGKVLKDVSVHTYGANKSKAKQILTGQHPLTVLNGRKTRSMYHNIVEPQDRTYVTVDGHMVSVWQGKRLTMDQAVLTDKEYTVIEAGIKIIALRAGLIPCQLQAILWLAHRRIHRVFYKPQLALELQA